MNLSNKNEYYKSCHKSHKGWSGFIHDRKLIPGLPFKINRFHRKSTKFKKNSPKTNGCTGVSCDSFWSHFRETINQDWPFWPLGYAQQTSKISDWNDSIPIFKCDILLPIIVTDSLTALFKKYIQIKACMNYIV